MNKLIRKAANNQVKYWNFSSQISDESKSNHPLYSNSSEPTTAAARRTASQTESMVVSPPVHIPAKPNDVFISFLWKISFFGEVYTFVFMAWKCQLSRACPPDLFASTLVLRGLKKSSTALIHRHFWRQFIMKIIASEVLVGFESLTDKRII